MLASYRLTFLFIAVFCVGTDAARPPLPSPVPAPSPSYTLIAGRSCPEECDSNPFILPGGLLGTPFPVPLIHTEPSIEPGRFDVFVEISSTHSVIRNSAEEENYISR